jgi:hypothetical protein
MIPDSKNDNSMNYWMASTVPPGVHPGDKFVEAFKKFCRTFTCPEGATAGQEIKIRPSDGAAELMDDEIHMMMMVHGTLLQWFLLLILFQSQQLTKLFHLLFLRRFHHQSLVT